MRFNHTILISFLAVIFLLQTPFVLAQQPQMKHNYYTVLEFDKLTNTKTKLRTKSFLSLYKDLLQTADEVMKQNNYSVMQKTLMPTSGSKHDYLSIGPYWWPDTTKADGFPWVRKDGKVNPLTREGSTDYENKEKIATKNNSKFTKRISTN